MTTLQELVDTSDFPIGATRRSIEDRIEKLIELLDVVDDDPDLEDSADDESWLGWPDARGPSQLAPPGCGFFQGDVGDDRELDTADDESTALERHGKGFYASGADDSESTHDDEPSLGGMGRFENGRLEYDLEGGESGETWPESEPSLGWPEQIDQERRLVQKSGWFADECEVECEDEGAQCDDEGVLEAL